MWLRNPFLMSGTAMLVVAMAGRDAFAAGAGRSAPAAAPAPEMDRLMVFGMVAVLLLLLCRWHEGHFPHFGVGTTVAAAAASTFGFLQGAWPLGLALLVYAVAAAVRVWQRRARHRSGLRASRTEPRPTPALEHARQRVDPSRMARMFGPQ